MESKSDQISLLDPACRIPTDVTFQVVCPDGQQVGEILQGHKKVMAIKSSAFEAMFYGPLKEDQQPIVIKETTFEAFKNMLNFLHDISEDWSRMELADLLHLTNLAERYTLPKMKLKVRENLKSFIITEENMLETAATAEEFACMGQESEALLQACSSCLEDSLVTPGDLQKFMVEQSTKDDKQGMVGIRLLARVKFDELAFADGPLEASNEEMVIIWKIRVIMKKLKKSSNTRSDLVKLKDLLGELVNSDFNHVSFIDHLHTEYQSAVFLVESLGKSIDMDKASAEAKGNHVHAEDVVEGSITHMQSVQVHLCLIKIMLVNSNHGDGFCLNFENVNELWESIVNNTLPEVHNVFFDWLVEDYVMFSPDDEEKVVDKLFQYTGPRSTSYNRLFVVIFGQ